MNYTISKKQLREFGLIIGLGFPLFIGWVVPSLTGKSFHAWTLLVGLPIFFLGIIYPRLLFYPYKVWMTIGNTLGFLNSHIILGLVFLLVLQPIALIMKILGHDPLRKKKKNVLTYREEAKNSKIDLTRIF